MAARLATTDFAEGPASPIEGRVPTMLSQMGAFVLVIAAVAARLRSRRESSGGGARRAQRRKIAAVLHENLSERTSLRQAANVLDHMQIGVYVARPRRPA